MKKLISLCTALLCTASLAGMSVSAASLEKSDIEGYDFVFQGDSFHGIDANGTPFSGKQKIYYKIEDGLWGHYFDSAAKISYAAVKVAEGTDTAKIDAAIGQEHFIWQDFDDDDPDELPNTLLYKYDYAAARDYAALYALDGVEKVSYMKFVNSGTLGQWR